MDLVYSATTEELYDLKRLNEVQQVNILTPVAIVKPYTSVILSVSSSSEEGWGDG